MTVTWAPISKQILYFTIAMVISIVLVLIAGWFTDFKQVLHLTLLSLSVLAFLPFVIISAGLALFLFCFILIPAFIAIVAAAGEGDVPVDSLADAAGMGLESVGWGVALFPRYYRFLGRMKHPLFWGIPAGLLLGVLLIWALIAFIIIPGEARTVEIMAETQSHIEKQYAHTKHFPEPDSTNHISLPAPDGKDGTSEQVLDGFGRPFHYELFGTWRFVSWRLVSHGFDGKPGKDDLCVSGASKGARLVETATSLIALFSKPGDNGKTPLSSKLEAISMMRCDD